jgi:hypothetical protein
MSRRRVVVEVENESERKWEGVLKKEDALSPSSCRVPTRWH